MSAKNDNAKREPHISSVAKRPLAASPGFADFECSDGAIKLRHAAAETRLPTV
jgi:hypothetical protein